MPTLEELAADAAAETPEASPGINVLVEKLAELKAMVDAAEKHLKDVRKEYDDLRKGHLPSVLSYQGVTSVRTPLGTLSLRSKNHASVSKERQAEAVAWCHLNYFETYVTVEPKNAAEIVSALIGDGLPVPDFIRVFTEEMVVLTRKKEQE